MPINPITGLEEDELDLDQVAAAPAMNPSVKEYLVNKFNLGNYTDENRQKLVDENSGNSNSSHALAALAALGAGFSGQNAGAAGAAILDRDRAEREAKVSQFDKGRAGKIQDYSLDRSLVKDAHEDELYNRGLKKDLKEEQRDDDLFKRESDPNSQESQMAYELAKSMGYNGAPITAQQFKNFSPVMAKRYDIEQKKLDRKEARDERRYQAGLRMQDKQELRDEKKAEKELALAVPGYERTGKVLPKPEEAAKFRKATAVSKQLGDKLKRMKELVKENGSFEYGGSGGTEMESLATEIQLLGKSPELYELGVLAGPDLKLLEKITASPTSWESLFTRDSSRQKQLDSQINSIQGKLQSTAESMGYAPEGGQSSKKDIVKTQTNQKTGQKRIVYSDGSVEVIDPVAGR